MTTPKPDLKPPATIENPMRYHPLCGTCGSRVNKRGVDKCAGCQKKELEKEAS